MGYVK